VIHPGGNRDITLVRIELDPALDRALLARYL